MTTELKPLGQTITTEAAAMEALFVQEISPGLSAPAKLSPKVAATLIEKGYAEVLYSEVGRDQFGAVVVSGHRLTVLGHMTYCQSCADFEDEGETEAAGAGKGGGE